MPSPRYQLVFIHIKYKRLKVNKEPCTYSPWPMAVLYSSRYLKTSTSLHGPILSDC